jgi:hypothetical protein
MYAARANKPFDTLKPWPRGDGKSAVFGLAWPAEPDC